MSRLIGSLKNYIEILFEIQCIHCTCVRSKSQLYQWKNLDEVICSSVSILVVNALIMLRSDFVQVWVLLFFISSHTWYTSVGLSKIQSHVFYVWFLYDKILDDLPVAQAFRVSNVKVHLSCNPICTRVCHFLKFNFWYKWIQFIYPVFFLILCLSH